MSLQDEIGQSIEIMERLRSPTGGCPWDLEQNFRTIVPHTIEEAYEVADAIESGDLQGLKSELGDLFFQVLFHSQMAKEIGAFDFGDVAAALNTKMVERHPHVFGDARIENAQSQTHAWERHKAKERAIKAGDHGGASSALDGVVLALPALTRATKIQARAARVGFDWERAGQVIEKVKEELDELQSELNDRSNDDAREDELGDLLFALVNLARHLKIDAETALRRATAKFERRFRRVEDILLTTGTDASRATLEEMERAWWQAKSEEA